MVEVAVFLIDLAAVYLPATLFCSVVFAIYMGAK